MDKREVENRIRSSYENIAPDILETILSDCDKQKGKVITMQNKKKATVRLIAGIAAALVLIASGIFGINMYRSNYVVETTVMLDVNPSIEIEMNKSEKVLKVNALNEDAKKIVGDMDFDGSSLDVTINALVGSMLRNGYISNAANSILVSVDNDDTATGKELQEKLMAKINAILESENVSGSVLGQTVTENKEVEKLAEDNGISVGKATMIKEITEQNTTYEFEDLVDLTINDLNLISESGDTKLENVKSIGTASTANYIGAEEAKNIALTHAGVAAENAKKVKCELDWENGIMVYEVDFDSDGYEYEYEINATTGAIVESEKEKDDDYNRTTGNTEKSSATTEKATASSANFIGEAAAKAAALTHAGLEESAITNYSCELGHEHGAIIYEVEFDSNGTEYEYDINATTGAVVKYSKEADDDHKVKVEATTATVKIDEASAKDIALKHAGVTDVTEFKSELELENGKYIYEIEFKAGGYEYDYEIDADSGDVIKSEKEKD